MESLLPYIEHFPYLGLFFLFMLGGLGLPFPEEGTLILAGFLISVDVVHPLLCIPVVYGSLLLSDFILYSLGRKYGRQIIAHRIFRRIITTRRLASLEERFKRRGSLLILLGRPVPGLRAQLFLVAGVLRMPPYKFIASDAVSSAVTMALLMSMGYLGGESIHALQKDIALIEHIVIAVLAVLSVLIPLAGYLKSRKSDR
jgi:membrane protein DedA with SNARE-associated domain